jgi:hypothetical protein
MGHLALFHCLHNIQLMYVPYEPQASIGNEM